MKRVSILAAGVLSAAIIPCDGWALGLGELTLHSYLNEPFRAEVALLEADAFDDSDVLVGLAQCGCVYYMNGLAPTKSVTRNVDMHERYSIR